MPLAELPVKLQKSAARYFWRAKIFPLAFFCVFVAGAHDVLAQEASDTKKRTGIFTDHGDVGDVKKRGGVNFDPVAETYQLSGSGKNMWAEEDQFQFVWRKLSGDFVLRCRCELLGEGANPHRKMGWMIRENLEPIPHTLMLRFMEMV